MATCARDQGFSLVNLLITLVLLSILLSLALPAFDQLIRDNRNTALRHLLIQHVQQTRTYAVAQRATYQLCGSSNGTDCDGSWMEHWLTFKSDSAASPKLLQQVQPPTSHNLCWSSLSKYLRFQADGTSPASNGHFALCYQQQPVWKLTINNQGRMRQETQSIASSCCSA